MNQLPPLSIVIPVYNGRELLRRLFASLQGQTVQPAEIIVVDNGSTDGAAEFAEHAGARVVRMGGNTGFARAVNRGIREASGPGVAVINSDVSLDARWIEELWGEVHRSECWFGSGMIFQAGTREVLDGSFDLICRGACSWRAGAGRAPSPAIDRVREIRFCPATAAIYRKELFDRAGGFDEGFESYLEDVEFGLRCTVAGFRGTFVPAATCEHQGSATYGKWSPQVVRLIARNQVLLLAKHYGPRTIRRWWWQIVTAQGLWGALAIRHGAGWSWCKGKAQGLMEFHRMRAQFPDDRTRDLRLEESISESERLIYNLQGEIGFDAYWRMYFRLAGASR